MYTIYKLVDLNGTVFYIGQTIKTVRERKAAHIKDARAALKKFPVLAKVRELDYNFSIIPIERCVTKKSAHELEAKWIWHYLDSGIKLLNKSKTVLRNPGDKYRRKYGEKYKERHKELYNLKYKYKAKDRYRAQLLAQGKAPRSNNENKRKTLLSKTVFNEEEREIIDSQHTYKEAIRFISEKLEYSREFIRIILVGKQKLIRTHIYEAIAEYYGFPCRK